MPIAPQSEVIRAFLLGDSPCFWGGSAPGSHAERKSQEVSSSEYILTEHVLAYSCVGILHRHCSCKAPDRRAKCR